MKSPRDSFIQTQWSVILAFDTQNPLQSDRAMSYLCETYWKPLFAFCLKKGHKREMAEDLVQSFFATFLERKHLGKATPDRGRFRTFLFTCFRNFLNDEWEKNSSQKRGGGKKILSIHTEDDQTALVDNLDDTMTAEMVYERSWALTLLRSVMDKLKKEYEEKGKEELFVKLQPYLVAGQNASTLKELANEMGMNQNTLRTNIVRMRKGLQKILINELMQTLEDPSDIEEEIGNLYRALTN